MSDTHEVDRQCQLHDCQHRALSARIEELELEVQESERKRADLLKNSSRYIEGLKEENARLLPLDVKSKFAKGDKVSKVSEDSTFHGVVVVAFRKLSGKVRYIVEDDRGLLLIQSDNSVVKTP